MTADIGVTETVRGDINKFEVWSKVVLYTVQAENGDIKNNWLNEIRKILMSQFEGAKVTLTQKLSSDVYKNDAKDQLRKKFKFLDASLRASTPALNLRPSEASERQRLDTFDEYTSQKKDKLRGCTSENNLLADDARSIDSAWSDSEFEDDDDVLAAHVEENSATEEEKQQRPVTIVIEDEEDGVSPRTQEQIKFCAIADYMSIEETELSFNQGDLLALVKEGEDGWWYCKNLGTNQEGWAPSGYLEINAVDVTDGPNVDGRPSSPPIEPTGPSPKKRLETAV